MKAAEFDRLFDEGEDIDHLIDWSSARRPNLSPETVSVDFPAWIVRGLDQEAQRLGTTRDAVIKVWIAERLPKAAA
jgi:hypothetical protein